MRGKCTKPSRPGAIDPVSGTLNAIATAPLLARKKRAAGFAYRHGRIGGGIPAHDHDVGFADAALGFA